MKKNNRNNSIGYKEIKAVEDWENRSINDKIEVAINTIKELHKKSKRNFVAWSGGKNSTLALYFSLQVNPDILVIFADTTVEIPGTYEYIDAIAKKWDLNLIKTKPRMDFWKIVDEYGLPDEQIMTYGKLYCREILKIEPVYKIIKKKYLTGHITGLSAFENRSRKMLIAKYGLLYKTYSYNSKQLNWPFWTSHPVAYFTDQDVFNTMKKLDIPVNPIYEKYGINRSGCLPCTAHDGWEEQVSKIDRKTYERILKIKGQSTLSNFIK